MSDEIDAYRRRLEAVRIELAARAGGEAAPAAQPNGNGGPDGDWDRGNVLGHVAELLPFWTAQVRTVVEDGRTEIGRGEIGWVQRREGIESGHRVGPDELRRRIDAGIDGVVTLLDGLRTEDLDRRVTFHTPRTGSREMELRAAIDELLVGHVEAHVRQLRELG
jgi:DinB family protein